MSFTPLIFLQDLDDFPSDEADSLTSHYGGNFSTTASATTTSATYEDMAGIKFPIRYLWPGYTQLEVYIACAMFSTATLTEYELGIQIDGTDYTVAHARCDNSGSTQEKSITGLGYATPTIPGVYTASLRWRRTTGAGVITMNSGTLVSVMAFERRI